MVATAKAGTNPQVAAPDPSKRQTIVVEDGTRTTWKLGETIGVSDRGEVKMARHTESKNLAVCKILYQRSADDYLKYEKDDVVTKASESTVADEVALLSTLRHEFICSFQAAIHIPESSSWYLLFDFVPGGSLLDYIIANGRMREKRAKIVARQIASALGYCHSRDIVHRDLKLEHIMLTKNGDVRIIGFRYATLYSHSSTSLLDTYCGSSYFPAPEMLAQKPYTGTAVDIWGFGIVLYTVVAGRVPFDADNMPQIRDMIRNTPITWPRIISSGFKHLVSRMFVKDPRYRATLDEVMRSVWMSKDVRHSHCLKPLLQYVLGKPEKT